MRGVDDAEFAIIRRIVKKHLPKTHRAFLFGSRATGANRLHSDYDLAVTGPRTLLPSEWGELHDALEEAPIVHEVDVVDLYPANQEFKEEVLRHTIPID